MSEDRMRILNMLADGKIKAEEAERLIAALGAPESGESAPRPMSEAKYLRVQVEKGYEADEREAKHVNLRVPLSLLRSGVRIGALMPEKARDRVQAALARKGMDVDLGKLRAEGLEAFIAALGETAIDIDTHDGKSKVKISCE